jgi:hypothetical protein
MPKDRLGGVQPPVSLMPRGQLWFPPLIIDQRRKKMLIRPLGVSVHVNEEPLSESAFPVALEGGVQVLLPVLVMQRQPDPREDMLVIPG